MSSTRYAPRGHGPVAVERTLRILVVDNDQQSTSLLGRALRAEGHEPIFVGDGADAEYLLSRASEAFDLVLLDLGVPGMPGEEVLTRLRRRDQAVPVIIVTARAELGEKVHGLDLGANDYVTKPFEFEELLARVRAAVRSSAHVRTSELVVADLHLDLLTKIARRGDRSIELAPREWALLELFMHHPDQVLSRNCILSKVWECDVDPGSNVVDVYVGYLRRKLNAAGLEPMLKTVRGAGYRLV